MSPSARVTDDAWLEHPISGDPLLELVPLRRHLRTICRAGEIPAETLERKIEACRLRIEAVDAATLAILDGASLPLSSSARQIVLALDEIHGLCAEALEAEARLSGPAFAAVRRLYHLQRLQLIAMMSFRVPPPDLMVRAIAAYEQAPAPRTNQLFGTILSLSAIRVEGFAPWEIALIAKAAERFAAPVGIRSTAPENPHACYWMTQTGHQWPTSFRRQPPVDRSDLLYFDCSALAASVADVAESLGSGTPAPQLGLPATANRPPSIEALRRAVAHWKSPRDRSVGRQKQIHGVQLCCRLGELWRSLSSKDGSDIEVSQWMTLNTGAQGCAVMHLRGNVTGLVAGGALGIRSGEETTWSVCLIRWARSENPAHIELGLEVLTTSASAVRVAPAGGGPASVLLLRANDESGTGEALLAARDQIPAGDFVLIEENDGRVKLTACKAGALRHQSSSTEVRDFQRLPMPAS